MNVTEAGGYGPRLGVLPPESHQAYLSRAKMALPKRTVSLYPDGGDEDRNSEATNSAMKCRGTGEDRSWVSAAKLSMSFLSKAG
jgi:hypothetical protein